MKDTRDIIDYVEDYCVAYEYNERNLKDLLYEIQKLELDTINRLRQLDGE